MGLRYINALTPADHFIPAISELNLKILLRGESLTNNLNLNFTAAVDDWTQTMIRIATPSLVKGARIVTRTANCYIDGVHPRAVSAFGFQAVDFILRHHLLREKADLLPYQVY